MLGIAIYKDSLVVIIDKVGYEYLVNYGGPVWIHASELTNIELITKGA